MMFKVSPVCMKMVNCLMNQQTLDFSQCHRQNMNMRPSEHPVVMCLGLPCSSCSVSFARCLRWEKTRQGFAATKCWKFSQVKFAHPKIQSRMNRDWQSQGQTYRSFCWLITRVSNQAFMCRMSSCLGRTSTITINRPSWDAHQFIQGTYFGIV